MNVCAKDILFANVEYFRLKRPERDKLSYSTIYPYYKVWFGPIGEDDTAQFGACAFGSYDNAIASGEEFKKTIYLPPHDVDKIEQGMMPYRYSLYSFVADGFLCLGDSAAISKPYSGEGITATWNLCKIAANGVVHAMKDGKYPTKNALWPINVKYSRTQGANFAEIMATLIGAVDATKEENEYEFKKSIVFDEAVMTQMNYAFANKMTIRQMLYLVNQIIDARANGSIRKSTISNIIKSLLKAQALKRHYKAFPKNSKKFAKWCNKADELWKDAGSMADLIEKSIQE